MKSEQLLLALDLYDSNELLDGIQYSLQVNVCLYGVSRSPAIRQIFDEWRGETKITRANLCYRTYLFNIQNMIDVLWLGSSNKQETRKKLKIGYKSGDMKLSEVTKDYTKEIVSHNPRPIGPYYAYNEHYLEIRNGMFENFRGIITWISIFLFLPTYLSGYLWVGIALRLLNHEATKIISNTFVMVIALILFLITFYLYIRYFRYVYRLELFTIRHIRIRFNRITRQV